MKSTGIKITKAESRHFNSIAAHIQPIAKSIERNMQVCLQADWEGMDRAFIEGKLSDLKANLQHIQGILGDMLPELWENEREKDDEDKAREDAYWRKVEQSYVPSSERLARAIEQVGAEDGDCIF